MLIKGVKSIKEIYWTLVVSHLVYIVPPPFIHYRHSLIKNSKLGLQV